MHFLYEVLAALFREAAIGLPLCCSLSSVSQAPVLFFLPSPLLPSTLFPSSNPLSVHQVLSAAPSSSTQRSQEGQAASGAPVRCLGQV